MSYFILVLVGFFLLLSSGYYLVKSIDALANLTKTSVTFLSTVIIAIGTSLPELVVSIVSINHKEYNIAIGNIFGSNIFNILFILGCCLLINPINVNQESFRNLFNYFLFIVYIWVWSFFFLLGKIFGLISFITFILILYENFLTSEKHKIVFYIEKFKFKKYKKSFFFFEIFKIILSLCFLLIGANYIVVSLKKITSFLNISSLVMSSLVIGIGTSLPELVTCLVASVNKKSEIVLGTVIGSNIFNILGVLGVSSLITNNSLSFPVSIYYYYFPMLILSLMSCILFLNLKKIFSLLGGFSLLVFYFIFFIFLSLNSSSIDSFPYWITLELLIILLGFLLKKSSLFEK